MSDHIHLHTSSLDKERNLILLFIPIIIFGLILAVYIFTIYSAEPAGISPNQTDILGEKDVLDRETNNVQK